MAFMAIRSPEIYSWSQKQNSRILQLGLVVYHHGPEPADHDQAQDKKLAVSS